jgi:hypothetical protein
VAVSVLVKNRFRDISVPYLNDMLIRVSGHYAPACKVWWYAVYISGWDGVLTHCNARRQSQIRSKMYRLRQHTTAR